MQKDNIFKRFISSLVGKGYNQLAQMIMRQNSYGNNKTALKSSVRSQLGEYSSWVYNCVGLISDRVSTIPFKFYNKYTDEELNTSSKGYKNITKPFYYPNDLMTFRFIKKFCQIQLDLCGMAAIYMAKNQLGQVWELWPLNMNDFKEVVIKDNGPMKYDVYYQFVINNKLFEFSSKELCVLFYPHPQNPLKPMSPIAAQAYAVDTENYIEVYERDFFKNSARVDMVLYTTETLDQAKATEIKQRWKEKYGGDFHDVAVLDSSLKPIPLNFTNKDFEFLNLSGWTKEKVLGAFRVPEAKIGKSAAMNRSGGVQVDINFNRESIHPRIVLWDEELSKEIFASFNRTDIIIRHNDPIPRDRQIELQEVRTFAGGMPVLTPNEIRSRFFSLPPVENDPDGNANKLWVSSNWRTIDEIANDDNSNPIGDNLDENDPMRHEGDKPHLNPDGSDDRDENTTENRLFHFDSLEKDLRQEWLDYLGKELISEKCTMNNIKDHFQTTFEKIIIVTGKTCYSYFTCKTDVSDYIKINESAWIKSIAKKASEELSGTMTKFYNQKKDWQEWKKEQFNTNPRVAKIINVLLRATINYSKYLVADDNDIIMHWDINRNECGHRGRVRQIEVNNKLVFKIGDTTFNFPGEKLNFTCDCTLVPVVNSD